MVTSILQIGTRCGWFGKKQFRRVPSPFQLSIRLGTSKCIVQSLPASPSFSLARPHPRRVFVRTAEATTAASAGAPAMDTVMDMEPDTGPATAIPGAMGFARHTLSPFTIEFPSTSFRHDPNVVAIRKRSDGKWSNRRRTYLPDRNPARSSNHPSCPSCRRPTNRLRKMILRKMILRRFERVD